jgi:putative transposase
MNVFDDLTDNEWALVEALFHMNPVPRDRRGRPRVDARGIVNGVLWTLASGGGWATLPGRYPSPPTCRRRFEEWHADGTIAELLKRLRTSGREVSLRGPLGATALQKPSALTSLELLRGAQRTRPESWRAPVTTG